MKNVEQFLNRVSLGLATVALLHLFFHTFIFCSAPTTSSSAHRRPAGAVAAVPFPRSSCEAFAREVLPPEKRFSRLRSSRSWRRRVDAFATLLASLNSRPSSHPLRLLSNCSRVLCVYAGAGHEVAAFQESGFQYVSGVDVVDFPPLVRRADPHNLPFFDNTFDLGFTAGVAGSLFPARSVSELERTVRKGGAIVVAVDAGFEVEAVIALFKRSNLVEVRNVSFVGSETSLIIMRKNETKSP